MNWVQHLAFNNIKKHLKRNSFSIAALIIGLTASYLIIGFSLNAENSIRNECYKQFDYGNLLITKENKSKSSNGGISIIRNTRPSNEEMFSMSNLLKDYEININLDALVPSYSKVTFGKEELKEFTYDCVYSFSDSYINKSLLKEGTYPKHDSLDEVLINEKAQSDFIKKYKNNPIGKTLSITHECDYTFFINDEEKTGIKDYFFYSQEVTVVGVVKDISFLSTPKIFYPYVALYDYLSSIYLNNLSTYYSRDYSWIERIENSSSSDPITSYNYRLFLKEQNKLVNQSELLNKPLSPFAFDSPSQVRTDALLGLVKAASTGMELFLVIALVGTALIMGIVSFSFYSEDRKTIAILSSLGAKMDSVNDIYCTENMMIGMVAFIASLILSPLLQLLINYVVKSLSGYENIIAIPFKIFLGIPFGFPLIIFASTIFVCLLVTILPISFSKKISLKEELKDE